MPHPEEYSVAVWVKQKGEQTRVFDGCYAYGRLINSPQMAAAWGLTVAIQRGLITGGSRYDIDVSEDASDEWTTVLQVNL
jgi:hypothetical protein